MLRWPGGNFSSNYHWTDGIGPRDQRPPRLEMAWGTVESNRFGTHEFLDYVRAAQHRALHLRQPRHRHVDRSAAVGGVLQFLRRHRHDAPAQAERPRAIPWKVKYWGLGNEMDGPWQMGHRSAEDYGKFALEAAKLMKWTDPSIKLIAAGSSNFGPGVDWTGWNRTVLEYLKHARRLPVAAHCTSAIANNDFGDFMASSVELDERIKTAEGIIDAALSGQPGNRKIYIAWDEWNVWYRARGNTQRGRRILEEHYNLEDALVVATFLNSFVNHAHIVKIANMAQLVNVIAPIFTNDKGIFLQTIYHPLALFANNTKGKALQLFVDSPKYKTRRFDDVPYLDVSAALDNGQLVINAVNRHPDQALEADFELEDKQFSGPVSVSEVNGPEYQVGERFRQDHGEDCRALRHRGRQAPALQLPAPLLHDAEGQDGLRRLDQGRRRMSQGSMAPGFSRISDSSSWNWVSTTTRSISDPSDSSPVSVALLLDEGQNCPG